MQVEKESAVTLSDRLTYYFLRLFIFISGIVPKSWTYALMKMLTMLFYRFGKRRRTITIDNLQQAFPELSSDKISVLSKEVFIALSKTIAEILLMLADKFDIDEAVINAESASKTLETLRKKYPHGQIVMTAHFSNW
ncbi:MAG: hypothetical protein KAG56_09825, partial [Sulfurovaceae bacterium]|nr:hypothetical protein [Sulfurovaceae bacterium]